MGVKSGFWLLLASIAGAQVVAPSNSSADLLDPTISPQFYINATSSVTFPGFLIAPLGGYSVISRGQFLSLVIYGNIVNTDTSNANEVEPSDFNLVSCDPEDYEDGNLQPGDLLRIITNQQPSRSNRDTSTLIFYSTRSNHCNATDFSWLPPIQGVFTTLDPVVAAAVVGMNFSHASPAPAALTADPATFTNTQQNSSSSTYRQPTTAIAMIILYSITGIITALFVVIIITGAVRAHRHPERYGPRNTPGGPRQSRAKGIARAMLETLPIVKFGDSHDTTKDKTPAEGDVELATDTSKTAETTKSGAKSSTITTTAIATKAESSKTQSQRNSTSSKNPDGTDDTGSLGCSICTEDFQKGEEVRVLPCNHKFHPDCVDPWLLNVSGTCPLCRTVLAADGEDADGNVAPPLAVGPFTDRRSQAIHNLMAIAYGTRDERVTALRQYRADRRHRAREQITHEARMSRARAFREVFRIRTRRHETAEVENLRASGLDSISGGQMRF